MARATLGPTVWAERTATLRSMTFDPGNGDPPVVCDGFGTPIPDGAASSPAPGPCGYVYRSYDDVTADLTVTITGIWEVTWRLSNGRSGTDPDLVTSVSFPFDVYEVQTVGTG